ncbi:unnamed protein product [Cuscuta campestris]|uniref:Reverse transcriptase zinc-binding domain-containing protein n=1 Tax=Cuscuta campestris TaxID=132261 RepID=A0A484ND16_9ASTE|nr:unnamed protein product [Cuscuta campestris]
MDLNNSPLCSKLKRLKSPLKTLNKNAFGHISRRALEAKEEYRLIMKEVMADPNNQALLDDAEAKRKRANFLLDAELEFYQQKAKCDFLMNSDRCTSYFHSLVKKNRKKLVIPYLSKDDGTKTTSSDEVVGCFLEFYQNLFGTTPYVGPIDEEILAAGATVPESAHSRLLATVTLEEVKDVVFDIGEISPLCRCLWTVWSISQVYQVWSLILPNLISLLLGSRDTSHDILSLVSFPRGHLPVRYLGLPLASQRISEADYAPLFKTVDGFLSKWKTMKISYAGKLELIRAVIQGVQSFWLQAFLVQKYVLERITSHCRDFLWGSKFAKVAWSDICKPKTEGGLGLKDAGKWNDALLCKLLWDLAAKKDSLWVRWVHSVYIKDTDFWQWQPKRRHSVFFKRLA